MNVTRLILWPSIVTALVSLARLIGEQTGWATTASGGQGFWLGITWLPFLFGPLFAIVVARSGSRPRFTPLWPIALLAVLAMAATIMWQFGPLIDAPQDDATFERVRGGVIVIISVTAPLALLLAWLWPRLAFVLLCYALPARLFVLALTWFAKCMEYDSHYTKFGPPGIERDMPSTMLSATVAQLGFWVPFTIVAGFVSGSLFARRAPQ